MLTIRDRTAISLAATPYRFPAVRETHARERLDMGPSRFWQRVNWLIEQPEAEVEMPREVRQLRRLRDARRAIRT